MSGNSRHVGNFLIVDWVQTQKLYGRVANSYVWADLYLSAVIEENWVCGPRLCRNNTQCRPRFGDIWRCRRHVGDTSATCQAKLNLSRLVHTLLVSLIWYAYAKVAASSLVSALFWCPRFFSCVRRSISRPIHTQYCICSQHAVDEWKSGRPGSKGRQVYEIVLGRKLL